MTHDRIDDLFPHLHRELDRIGVDLAVADRFLPFRLAVEADNRHLRRLPCLLEGPDSAERRRIVDGEDTAEIAVGLEGILGRLVAGVAGAAGFELGDNFDRRMTGREGLVVGIDHLTKATDAKQATLGLLEVEDGDFAPAGPEGLDHRGGGFLAAAEVVGGDLRDDLRVAAAVGDVDGKDGDTGGIRFGDHRADRLGVAGGKDDRRHFADDEVLDLIPLLGDILVGADNLRVERLLARLGGDRVADELEERIVEREQRDADRAGRHPAGGASRRPA